MTNSRKPKASPRVLIVEDELLIALMIEEMIRRLGYRVAGVAHTMPMAHLALAKRNFDAVLLDIELDGNYSLGLADILLQTGIPFAFLTGYDYLVAPRFEKIPLLEKPFTPDQLGAFLRTLFELPSPCGDVHQQDPRPGEADPAPVRTVANWRSARFR